MPETLSADIRTGYSPQTAFDIKLDTFNRMNEVFNRPSKAFGIDYYDPLSRVQGAGQGGTAVAPAPPMDFNTALLSDDPKVRDLALDALEKSASSDPYARLNVGTQYRTAYDKNAQKFMDKEFGFDMFSDNEDFYYRNSYLDDGWFTRALKNVGRFAGRVVVGTATKFLEGVGYLGSMVTNGVVDGAKALAGNEVHYWEDVADNTFSKIMKNANDDFRDHVLPVYKEAGFDEKGFFSQLGNYAYWNDTFADGVAFLASAFIPAGIASKTGLLAKGVSLGAQVGADASAAARIGAGIRGLIRGATGAETYGEAGLTIFNVANEAAFEATGQYTQTKQELLEARERGENALTDREIQEAAGKAAASTFKWNFPALMVSNAWEMKNIIKPIIGRGKNSSLNTGRTIVTQTGELGFKPYANKFFGKIADSRIGRGARFYTPKAVRGTLMEGFWEENVQLAITRSTKGNYARMGDDTEGGQVTEQASGGFFGIVQQYAKQTIDALKGNDRENALGIGTGALIGILGGVAGSKFGRRINPITGQTSFTLGERRQQQLALDAVFEETNNAYNNFLSLQDVKNPDGSINEVKLTDKVAAFENFTRRQQILDELKDKKQYPPHELDALQNELLNQYAKGLIKVDKLQDAVRRIQDLAARNVEEKGEQFMSNPVQVATYLNGLAETYDDAHRRPDHLSAKHTPAQMQEINISIKDRAYDLRAHRKAIDPILKFYQKQSTDNFNLILNTLLADPRGADIQEGFARSRATDYIKALAQKEVFNDLLKEESPEFLRNYYQQRIREADNQIAAYNKELGANAPEIKDGEATFKDEILDFEDKTKHGLKPYLDAYKTAYRNEAQVEFAQQSYEFLADAIQDPETGLQNWFDYRDTELRKAVVAGTPTQQSFTVGDQTFGSIQALDKALVDKVITQEQYDAAIKAVTTPTEEEEETTETGETAEATVTDPVVVSEGVVITDEKDAVQVPTDKVDPTNPLSWYTPNKKSTDDTVLIGKESEQLKDVPYNEAIKLIVRNTMADLEDANSKYKFFIVKDTYPEIYMAPADNEQKDVVPTGEVIIMKDLNGKQLLIGDLLPNKFKDLAELPVVFSFEKTIFRNAEVAAREAIWEREMKAKPGEAALFYQSELDRNIEARDFVKDQPSAEIQVVPIHSTDGIMPTTGNTVPVIQRFGDQFTVDVKLLKSKQFKAGTIIAIFGKISFPVGTARLSSVGSELTKVEKILAKQFDTEQEAKDVRERYLNVMFYTNENQNFGIKKVGDKWQLYFRKIDDRDKGLSPEDKRKFLRASVDYGNLRFNVAANQNANALKDGMNVYNPDTNSFEAITAEQYQEFIKTKVVTNLKKVIDKDGNLYMKPVNAYFSFKIDESQLQEQKPKAAKENAYNKVVARIKQLIDTNGVTKENIAAIKKGIGESLKQKLITQEQFTKLNERLTTLEAEAKKKPKAKETNEKTQPQTTPVTKKDTGIKPKTETEEDEEEKRVKELKKKKKGAAEKDVNATLGNAPSAALSKDYVVALGENSYNLNQTSGAIKTVKGGLTVVRNAPAMPKILAEMAKSYPYTKAKDGSISGVFVAQLEGKNDTVFTAYGLPAQRNYEYFVDDKGKIVTSQDVEVPHVELLRTLLTDKGKTQLEEFLKRNC